LHIFKNIQIVPPRTEASVWDTLSSDDFTEDQINVLSLEGLITISSSGNKFAQNRLNHLIEKDDLPTEIIAKFQKGLSWEEDRVIKNLVESSQTLKTRLVSSIGKEWKKHIDIINNTNLWKDFMAHPKNESSVFDLLISIANKEGSSGYQNPLWPGAYATQNQITQTLSEINPEGCPEVIKKAAKEILTKYKDRFKSWSGQRFWDVLVKFPIDGHKLLLASLENNPKDRHIRALLGEAMKLPDKYQYQLVRDVGTGKYRSVVPWIFSAEEVHLMGSTSRMHLLASTVGRFHKYVDRYPFDKWITEDQLKTWLLPCVAKYRTNVNYLVQQWNEFNQEKIHMKSSLGEFVPSGKPRKIKRRKKKLQQVGDQK